MYNAMQKAHFVCILV